MRADLSTISTPTLIKFSTYFSICYQLAMYKNSVLWGLLLKTNIFMTNMSKYFIKKKIVLLEWQYDAQCGNMVSGILVSGQSDY